MGGRPRRPEYDMLLDYWQKWEWPKKTFEVFRKEYYRWIDIEEAISKHKKFKRRTEKYTELWKLYDEYEWDKCKPQTYYQRMKRGFKFEDAIKATTYTCYESPNKPKVHKAPTTKVYVRVEQAKPKPDSYFRIEVTYDKDTARVFKRAYQRQIDDLEEQIYNSSVKDALKLIDKQEKLKQEFEIFKSYNN